MIAAPKLVEAVVSIGLLILGVIIAVQVGLYVTRGPRVERKAAREAAYEAYLARLAAEENRPYVPGPENSRPIASTPPDVSLIREKCCHCLYYQGMVTQLYATCTLKELDRSLDSRVYGGTMAPPCFTDGGMTIAGTKDIARTPRPGARFLG